MSENSKIEWCDHTFNPWEGCQKVGPGCDHCYAEARNARFGGGAAINWGPGAPRRRTSAQNWLKPLQWNLRAARAMRRDRVFCASLADVFDNAAPDEWRADLGRLITQTAHLDWLLLTKRIGNADAMLAGMFDGLGVPDNVWIGATIVNQEEADRDIQKLLAIDAPVHFLSVEPMLGPINLSRWLDPTGIACMDVCPETPYVEVASVPTVKGRDEVRPICQHCGAVASWTGYDKGIDWVICGGESGPGTRPMHPDWPRSLREQCAEAGVPFLFKQWGEWKSICQMDEDETRALYRSNRTAKEGEDQGVLDELHGRTCKVEQLCLRIDGKHAPIASPNAFLAGTSPMHAFKVGKRAAGRLLDGRTHDEFPEVS